MLKANGYGVITDPGAKVLTQESDNLSCAHCPRIEMTRSTKQFGRFVCVVYRKDGTSFEAEAGFCRNCMKHICPACIGKPCTPRMKRIEDDEKRSQGGVILP